MATYQNGNGNGQSHVVNVMPEEVTWSVPLKPRYAEGFLRTLMAQGIVDRATRVNGTVARPDGRPLWTNYVVRMANGSLVYLRTLG